MATSDQQPVLSGELLEEDNEITLVQLCQTCRVEAETVEALVEHGILAPSGKRGSHWCFTAASVKRTQIALRLQRDLDVNLPGAALALELLERIDALEARLRRGDLS